MRRVLDRGTGLQVRLHHHREGIRRHRQFHFPIPIVVETDRRKDETGFAAPAPITELARGLPLSLAQHRETHHRPGVVLPDETLILPAGIAMEL